MSGNNREVVLDVEVEEYEMPAEGLFKKATGLVRSALMVGLGAADLTQEKVVGLWEKSNKMVVELEERGEQMSEKRRGQIDEQVERRQSQIKDLSEKAGDSFEKYSEAVLTRVNMPTAEDIDSLSKQVSALSRKVDKVRKEQQEVAA
jgi:polyhydroxyalkanoate synthesis regulator phasin